MGCHPSRSGDVVLSGGEDVNRAKEKETQRALDEEKRVYKLLLLGPAGAGRRTLLLQCQRAYNGHQSETSLEAIMLSKESMGMTDAVEVPDVQRVACLDFEVNCVPFRIYCPSKAMQQSPRADWLEGLGNKAYGVLFVASMADYALNVAGQQLEVDDDGEKINALDAQIESFGQIVNSRWLKRCTSCVLILNKKDLFEQQLQTSPLHAWDARAPNSKEYLRCAEYVKEQFCGVQKSHGGGIASPVRSHFTCLTDEHGFKWWFNSIITLVLEGELRASGLV